MIDKWLVAQYNYGHKFLICSTDLSVTVGDSKVGYIMVDDLWGKLDHHNMERIEMFLLPELL